MSPFGKPHTEQTKAKVSVDIIFITQISNVAMIKGNIFTSRVLGIDVLQFENRNCKKLNPEYNFNTLDSWQDLSPVIVLVKKKILL